MAGDSLFGFRLPPAPRLLRRQLALRIFNSVPFPPPFHPAVTHSTITSLRSFVLLTLFASALFSVRALRISASRSVQSSLSLPLLPLPRPRAPWPPWTSLPSTSPAPTPQRYIILLQAMMYTVPPPSRSQSPSRLHSCSMIQIIFASSYSISYVPLSIFARTRAPPPTHA